MQTTRQLLVSTLLLMVLSVGTAALARGTDGQSKSPEIEIELQAVLRSDAPPSEKAIACKRLAIHGSSAAVHDLAPLLQDPQLASWARIALEAIPGTAAAEALQQAMGSLQGSLLVGTINSIGVRRDASATRQLTARLQDQDGAVASAAAVALGRIGNAESIKSLRQSLAVEPLEVRSAVAEGCVLCAERLAAAGELGAAANIYDQVRTADVPRQRIIEATRGAILARREAGIPLLLEQFRSPDERLFQLALSTAREFPGDEVDAALAAVTDSLEPRRAALMIRAMADREATVRLTAVLAAARQGPRQVRLAAIDALGRMGDTSCLPALMAIAIGADQELAQAAKSTLARLPGADVDAHIVALLATAKGKSYPLLIELVGQRRVDAQPALLRALDDADGMVRQAALTALGETVSLPGLSALAAQVVTPRHPEDATAARQALRAASVRMPDREACAAEIALLLEGSPAAIQLTLLEILADVGGANALNQLHAAAKSDNRQLQDTASRLLGKWNSLDAAPVLLDLAKTSADGKYHVRALRGYIGLARKFAMPAGQRAEMCQTALAVARRPGEQKLVLEVVKLHPSLKTLQVAIAASELPELKEEATQAALAVARQLAAQGIDVSQP